MTSTTAHAQQVLVSRAGCDISTWSETPQGDQGKFIIIQKGIGSMAFDAGLIQ